MLHELLRRLWYYLNRRRFEAELDEEMRHHLALKERDSGSAGAAYRQFGNVGLLKEDSRVMWAWTFWEQLMQDLRYAARTAIHNRAFTALAVLSLALGIGANTAIYSFMDAILLRSLPVSDPGSLAVLNWHAPPTRRGETVMHGMSGDSWGDAKSGETSGMFPYPAFELFRKNDSVFSIVFGHYRPWRARNLNVMIQGQADIASGEYVSGDFFRGLAAPPAAGRLIIPDDDRRGAPAVAVVSHAFSQRHFGDATGSAGQSILIDSLPFTVVGVTPPGFFGVDPAAAPDLYLPMHSNMLGEVHPFNFRDADYADGNYYWIQVMGRLRPGVSRAQAQAALAPPFQQWVASTATNDAERAHLPALVIEEGAGGLGSLRREYSKPIYVLLALVGLILAIACANIANLLLARAAARSREMALRLSVGAGRFRVVRQMLTESVLLSSLGGVLGVALAIWGIRFLTLLLAHGERNFTLHAELNWHVLGAAAALSFLTGALFGLVPALQATRLDVVSALKETRLGHSGARHSGWRAGHILVVSQIAISLLILVAAGLFVRTLSNLQSVELGFNRENVLLFQLDARKAGHKDPEIAAFYGDLWKRFTAVPGVRTASLSESSLIDAGTGHEISVPGAPPDPDTRMLTVGPAFFTTMQIPILAGREIEERDRTGAPQVAVINERFAQKNFGDRNPVGQHLILRGNNRTERDMEIVGVSRNARYGGIKRDFRPVVFMPYDQGYPEPREMVYELRTAGNPLEYVNSVREIVRQADARVPVTETKTQVANINETISQEITLARLCTAFAILALAIAGVGLYGTVSYNVARRTGEIGIRMALGAQRGVVVRMVLGEVCLLVAAGLAISVPAALPASKFIESFLFGTKHNDPLALTLAVAVLLGAALLAGYVPAWKASQIDPTTALRHE